MNYFLTLFFDGALAILLIVTIGYCARLSRRIRLLQDSRGELAGMIAQFDQTTGRAMSSLAELQTTSKRIVEALQLKIEKANFLADDLAFLFEKSGKIITQLEQLKTPLPPEAPRLKTGFETAPLPGIFNKVEKPKAVSAAEAFPKPTTSIEALIQQLATAAGKAASAAKPSASTTTSPQTLRTEAERELLEALKSGR